MREGRPEPVARHHPISEAPPLTPPLPTAVLRRPSRPRTVAFAGLALVGLALVGLALVSLALTGGPASAGSATPRPAPTTTPRKAPARKSTPVRPATRPPDILLITVDTLRPDRLPFGGCALNTAPFLDSLAAGAVICERTYSVSSWTLPALASLHTGLYPASHGTTHGMVKGTVVMGQETLPTAQPTLAEIMRRRGYLTLAVVANSHLTPGWGFERGFDRFICVNFMAANVVNDSLRALRAEIEDRSRPLFLWVHYFDPHHPYRTQQPWFDQLHPEIPRGRLQFAESVMSNWNNPPPMAQQHMGTLMNTAKALYDSEIRATDQQIRAIWTEFPRLSECFLAFTADHGEEFREHQSTTHGHNLFDTTVRVPLFLRPPGGGRPDTLRGVVSLVDVPPTLTALAGARIPSNWAGAVLYRAGAATPPPAERSVMAELDRNPASTLLKAWIGPRWKLIQDLKTQQSQLYDLQADPGETQNLARQEPARAALELAALKRCLADLPVSPPMSPERLKAMTPEVIQMLKSLGYLN